MCYNVLQDNGLEQNHEMRVRARRKKINAVRVLHWALIVYLLIAVLHGAIPAIWRHHVENGDRNGPFRILLFTLLLLAVSVFLPLLLKKFSSPPELGTCVYVTPEYLLVWTLRGPPSLIPVAR
jgi:hypothetical protein